MIAASAAKYGRAVGRSTSMIPAPSTDDDPCLVDDTVGSSSTHYPPEASPLGSRMTSGAARRDLHAPPVHEHPEDPEAWPHVPVAAARLAHVLVRDADERVALGLEQHLLAQLAVQLVPHAAELLGVL